MMATSLIMQDYHFVVYKNYSHAAESNQLRRFGLQYFGLFMSR